MKRITLTTCLLLLTALPTVAQPGRLTLSGANLVDLDMQLRRAQGHPNEVARIYGLKAFSTGRYPDAVRHFKRSAWYADKRSQHFLSLMYWYGEGVSRDPVQAYIWSDLAAERGTESLLAIREKMWAGMDAAQRQSAVADGVAYYDEYGDATAKVRTEREIRRFSTKTTGSHAGFRQRLGIQFGHPTGQTITTPAMTMAASLAQGGTSDREFYADERVDPRAYWDSQDEQIGQTGTVELGPLENPEPK